VLLDYLLAIYSGAATTITMSSGIASAEAFGVASLIDAHDTGNASRQTTIHGGHVTRPVTGSRSTGIGGSRGRGVR